MSGICRDIHFATKEEWVEYNETLYKAVLALFTHHIDAAHLKDCPHISEKLTVTEMQKIQREYDNSGQNCGARKLLEFLYRKDDWFKALMHGLDTPDLKVASLKPMFLEEKDKVDREWVAKHPQPPSQQAQAFAAPTPVGNPSVQSSSSGHEPGAPTQSNEDLQREREERDRMMMPPPASPAAPMDIDMQPGTGASATVSDGASGGDVTSDFRLTPGQDIRLRRDAVEDVDMDPVEERPGGQQTAKEETTAREGGGAAGPRTSTGDPEEQYTDARSSDYEVPVRPGEEEHTYAYLANSEALQTDATPMPEQTSDVPQPEAGVDAEPQVPAQPQQQQQQQRRHRRPQTREEHPSLRQAISGDPRKDMEGNFVRLHLSAFDGWTPYEEEHQVIRIIRNFQNMDGIYVIWYWSLAKRPTVCVTYNGRVITFVVHKSPHEPPVFYFNKRQKKCGNMAELLRYHLDRGIRYTPQDGQAVDIRLVHPFNADVPQQLLQQQRQQQANA